MSETIGNRIKHLREEKEWSQRELADRVGINYSVINRIELDKRPVKDHEISKFADVFSVTTDYIMCKTDKRNGQAEKRQDENINTAFYDFDNLTEEEKEYLETQLEIFRKFKEGKRSEEK
jgi:transcriptional regulator with XRE-family HTH domain